MSPPNDGYLRLSGGRRHRSREAIPPSRDGGLLFVDLDEGLNEAQQVAGALQEITQQLTGVGYMVFRWPELGPPAEGEPERLEAQRDIAAWLEAISPQLIALGAGQSHTGAIRFRLGEPPQLVWSAHGQGDYRDIADDLIEQRALRAELAFLLEWGHAIWRPDSYHYELASGEHSGTFVRVGDAFRTPRDVRAISSWLASRLRDGTALVCDSATLTPLLTDLRAMMREHGWVPGPVEILDEYPHNRLDVLKVIRPLHRAAGGVLALLSVNASGRSREMMHSALATSAPLDGEWSLITVVDMSGERADARYSANATGPEDRISTWHDIPDRSYNVLDQSGCQWCRDNRRAPRVGIDPRTFGALILPALQLVTPDTTAARLARPLWQTSFETGALSHSSAPAPSPSVVARPKLVSCYGSSLTS